MSVELTFRSCPVNEKLRNYDFYKRLWSLQDFFRNPSAVFTPENWNVLTMV